MIEVTGCRILVKPQKIQEYDKVIASAIKAGLVLPEQSDRKEQVNVDKGIVLQVGEKCHPDYLGTAKVGDLIGYAKFGGKFIQDPVDEELYLVINDEDVICIFKE